MFEIGAQRKGESVIRVLRAASEKHCVILKYCYNWTPVYSEIVGSVAFVNQVCIHSVKTSTQSIQNFLSAVGSNKTAEENMKILSQIWASRRIVRSFNLEIWNVSLFQKDEAMSV